MFLEAVLGLEEPEGCRQEGLQHVQEPGGASVHRVEFVHQDGTKVQEAGMGMVLI